MPLIQAFSNAATVILLSSGLWLLAGPGSLLVPLLVVGGYGLQVLRLRSVLQNQKRAVMKAEMESSHLVLNTLSQIRRMLLEAGQKSVLARHNELNQKIVSNASWAGEAAAAKAVGRTVWPNSHLVIAAGTKHTQQR